MQIHQQTKAKEGKPKVPTSGKKIPALLGQRDLDSEEPSEHDIGETSSEDEAEVCFNITAVIHSCSVVLFVMILHSCNRILFETT